MKRILSLILSLTLVCGLMNFSFVSADTTDGILLNENFENYAAGTKIFSYDGNSDTLSETSSDGKWTSAKYGGTVGTLEVVSAGEITTNSDNRSGNLLKYTSSGASYGVVAKVENADNRGKVVVYEYDVYINGSNDLMLPSYTDETSYYYPQNAKFPIFKYSWGYQAKMGTGIGIAGANNLEQKYEAYTSTLNESNSGNGGNQSEYGILEKNKWHTVKVVVDTSETATASRPDTYRAYIDGELVYGYYCYGNGLADKSKKVYDFAQQYYTSNENGVSNYAVGNMQGLHFGAPYGQSATMYLDNMKAYTLDKFKLVSGDNAVDFDPNSDTLDYTFSTKISADKISNVKITSENGEEIVNAINLAQSTLSADGKTVSLKFNEGALAGNTTYKTVFPMEFTDVNGQSLVTYVSSFKHKAGMPAEDLAVPETYDVTAQFKTVKAFDSKATLMDEKFENYTAGTKIFYADGSDSLDGNFDSADGKWSVRRVGDSKGSLEVVDADESIDPEGARGNVLKYTNTNSYWTVTAKIDNANNRGKMLVYEYDFYRTDAGETEFPSYFDGTTQTHEFSKMAMSTPSWGYQLNMGTGVSAGTKNLEQKYEAYAETLNMTNSGNGGDGATYGIVDPGKWHSVKVVVDTSETATASRPDTYRVYIDGEIVYGYYCYGENGLADQSKKVYDFVNRFYTSNETGIYNYSLNDIQGLHFGYSWGNNAGALYLDNMKVYTVDKFKITSVANTEDFEPASETLNYTFQTPVSEDKISTVKIITADGAEVANAINFEKTTLSADGKTLSIKLNDGILSANTSYKTVFPMEFTDIYNQSLVTYVSSFKHKAGMPVEDLSVPETYDVAYGFKTAASFVAKHSLLDENFEDYLAGTRIFSADGSDALDGNFDSEDGKWSVRRVGDSIGSLEVVDADESIDPEGARGNVLKYTNTNSYWTVTAKIDNANNRGKMLVYEYDFYRTDAGETEFPSYFDGTTQTHEFSKMAMSTPSWGYQLNMGTGVSAGTKNLEQKYEAYAETLNMTNSGNGGDGATYGIVDPGKWHSVKVVVDTSETATASRPDTYRVYIDGEIVYGYYCYGENGLADQSKKVYDFANRFYTSNENGISNYSLNDIQGLHFGYGWGNNSGALYLDNMKAYTVDTKFKVLSSTETDSLNPYEDVLTYTFSTPVKKGAEAYVYVADENGEKIESAIDSAVLSDDGCELKITLNANTIKASEEYKLVFPVEFTDAYGQGLATYYAAFKHKAGMPVEDLTVPESAVVNYNFATPISYDLYAKDISKYAYNTTEKTISASFKLKNIANSDLPAWCVLAAYNGGKLLGVGQLSETVAKDTETEIRTLTISDITAEEAASITEVKLFVWNSYNNMAPYHISQILNK